VNSTASFIRGVAGRTIENICLAVDYTDSANCSAITPVGTGFCCHLALSCSDAAYVCLARLLSGKWVTCDGKAHTQVFILEFRGLLGRN